MMHYTRNIMKLNCTINIKQLAHCIELEGELRWSFVLRFLISYIDDLRFPLHKASKTKLFVLYSVPRGRFGVWPSQMGMLYSNIHIFCTIAIGDPFDFTLW